MNRYKPLLKLLSLILLASICFGIYLGLSGSYRYDETNAYIGSASIPIDAIQNIQVNWSYGDVTLVSCQDTCLSFTEEYDGELAEKNELRYILKEQTLSIYFMGSTYFQGKIEKTLTLRIPESMSSQLEDIQITTKKANVSIKDLDLSQQTNMTIQCGGTLSMEKTQIKSLQANAAKNISLQLVENAPISIQFKAKGNVDNLTNTPVQNNTYTIGQEPTCSWTIVTRKDLKLYN